MGGPVVVGCEGFCSSVGVVGVVLGGGGEGVTNVFGSGDFSRGKPTAETPVVPREPVMLVGPVEVSPAEPVRTPNCWARPRLIAWEAVRAEVERRRAMVSEICILEGILGIDSGDCESERCRRGKSGVFGESKVLYGK